VDSYGHITGLSTSGTAKTQYAVTIPNAHSGTNALLQVYITGTTYVTNKTYGQSFLSNYDNTAPSHSGTDDGRGFQVGDTYTISGASVGGATGVNDIIFRVASVGGGVGEIRSYEFLVGTGPAVSSFGPLTFPLTSAIFGYPFSLRSIRDSSDWTAYRRQQLIKQENKSKIVQDPWFAKGNDYRIQFLLGKFKCGPCDGGAFNQGSPS
jgi:hypothetical protein